jgi:hypothetical protein
MYIGTDFYVNRNADVYVQFTNFVLQVLRKHTAKGRIHHLPSARQAKVRNPLQKPLRRLQESHRPLCTLHRCTKEKVR